MGGKWSGDWSDAIAGAYYPDAVSTSDLGTSAGAQAPAIAFAVSKATGDTMAALGEYADFDGTPLGMVGTSDTNGIGGNRYWTGLTEVVFTRATEVDKPVANEDLVYTGEDVTGVDEADGYALEENTGVNAGSYTATASLAEGYVWSDGTTDDVTIDFVIEPAVAADTTEVGAGATVDEESLDAAADAIAEGIENLNSLVLSVVVTAGADSTEDQELIAAKLAEGQKAEYFSIKLLLSYVTSDGTVVENVDYGDDNTQLVSVVYPFTFTSRTDVHVYRVHNGEVAELTSSPNAAGEYVTFDTKAGTITVTCAKYSTFGVGYTQQKTVPNTGDGAATKALVFGGIALAALCAACVAGIMARRRSNR